LFKKAGHIPGRLIQWDVKPFYDLLREPQLRCPHVQTTPEKRRRRSKSEHWSHSIPMQGDKQMLTRNISIHMPLASAILYADDAIHYNIPPVLQI